MQRQERPQEQCRLRPRSGSRGTCSNRGSSLWLIENMAAGCQHRDLTKHERKDAGKDRTGWSPAQKRPTRVLEKRKRRDPKKAMQQFAAEPSRCK